MPNDNSTMGERIIKLIRKRDSKMYGYYRSVFEDGFDGGYPIAYDQEIADEIQSEIDRAVGETEKAYGGCRKCYGKGYSTVKDYTTGHDDFIVGEGFVQENNPVRPCSCDRGKQIISLITKQS